MSGVDSCYSWVVASASCLILFLVSCPARLGAQLYVSLLDHFDTSRKEASFPFVLAQVVRCASGPLAGVLSESIGLQGVTILGCLLCTIGVGGCFLAEDVITIDLCLGVVYGIGYGWSNALIPEILNRHFKKHRKKAYGIFLSGAGVGSFLVPPILELTLKEFGVSGTFLIMSAIILNSVPAAMLLTVPNSEKKRTNLLPMPEIKVPSKLNKDETENNRNYNNTVVTAMTRSDRYEDSAGVEIDLKSDSQTSSENSKIQLKNGKVAQANGNHVTNIEEKYEKETRTDVILNEEGASQSLLNNQQMLDECFRASARNSSLNLKDGNFKPSKKSLFSKFSILWSPEYLIITSIQAVNSFANQLFWTIMVDFVRDKGIEQYLEVYFVMFLSLFDTIGRFLLGSITDKGLMTITNFSVCSFVVIGFTCVLLAWLPEFFSVIAIISLMGLTFGGCTIAMPALITEFVIKEKRSIAMASRLLFSAPLCLTIPPLIGLFRGSLGSYDGLLYLIASMCTICVILILLLPLLTKRRARAQMKENT